MEGGGGLGTMRRYRYFILLLVCLTFASCASSKGGITFFTLPSGASQMFLQPVDWRTNHGKVTVDITYRNEKDAAAICNISAETAGKTPSMVKEARFIGDGAVWPLQGIKLLFFEKNTVRITSTLPSKDFRALLAAGNSSLVITFTDGKSITCRPPHSFRKNKETMLFNITYSEDKGHS
jgi:hypothetical protein